MPFQDKLNSYNINYEKNIFFKNSQKVLFFNGFMNKMKFCRTCMIIRPIGTSHCKKCNICIERYDHHCPWLGNCLGRNNYKY
jgi:palmitoyltransferase ZDHHC9/14/18